jgi:hypothetical protein
MGYTHYFSFSKAIRGDALKTEKTYQKAVKECAKIIRHYSETFGGLSGFSAHTSNYGGIMVNGSERVGQCEPFVLREHYSQNLDGGGAWFCKTRQYPYDTVVTACLIVLNHRLGDTVAIGSDGNKDDWNDGLTLAQKVLGLKTLKIPDGVRPNVSLT